MSVNGDKLQPLGLYPVHSYLEKPRDRFAISIHSIGVFPKLLPPGSLSTCNPNSTDQPTDLHNDPDLSTDGGVQELSTTKRRAEKEIPQVFY